MECKKYIFITICLLLTGSMLHAQNPGGVTGFNCWYAANNGVTPATAGSTVTNWNCINCGTYNLTQDNPGIGPIYEQKLINFNPCVTFTNNNATDPTGNECLGNSTIFNQIQTGFIVERLDSTIPGYVGIVHEWEQDNTALGRAMGSPTSIYSNGRGGNDFALGGQSGTNPNGTFVDGVSGLAHHYRWHICRVEIPTPYTSTNNTVGIQFGWYDFGHWPPDGISVGDLSEVVEYPGFLNYIDANRVESYLAVKHGITLNQTAPGISYRSSNYTIIWDSTNAPYNNNITGIGRDDASGLDQRQSLSIDSADGVVTIYNGNTVGAPPATNLANSNSISADQNFELFADNEGVYNALSTCYDAGQYIGIARIWKVQKTGAAIGTVTLSVPAALLPAGITVLLVSHNDPTFSAANTTAYTLNSTAGILSYAVTLQNNDYFTYGEPIKLSITHVNASCSNAKDGSATVSFTGPVAPISYSWNTVPAQSTATASAIGVGFYTVTVTFTGGCVATDTVTIHATNTAFALAGTIEASCTNINNGSITVNTKGGTAPYTFQMTGTAAQTDSTYGSLAPGTYTVVVTDSKGCHNTDTYTVPASIIALVIDSSASCLSSPTGTISVIASGGILPYTYSLDNQVPTNSGMYTGLVQGAYTVLVTDSIGCTAGATIEVDSIVITDSKTSSPSCTVGATGSLEVIAGGGLAPYTYAISKQPKGRVIDSSYIVPTSAGTYNITITDKQGCVLKDTIIVPGVLCCSIQAPNAFTPNGDGVNDNFIPIPSGLMTSYLFNVYDRWGNLMFSTNNVSDGWNGTYDGKEASIGVYVYFVKAICATGQSIEEKGNITLLK